MRVETPAVRCRARLRARNGRANVAGMTLLELLVAIAVFALVAAAAYLALAQGLAVQEQLQERRRFWQRLDMVFNQVYADLGLAVDRAPRAVTGDSRAFIGHGRDSVSQYGHLLEFTRSASRDFRVGPASPFLRVAYRLYDGELYRRVWSRVDHPYGAQPTESLLLAGVEELQVRYFSGANAWATRWPPTGADAEALPRAVELALSLPGHGRYRWLFHVGAPR